MRFKPKFNQNKKQIIANNITGLASNGLNVSCSGHIPTDDSSSIGQNEAAEPVSESTCAFCKTDFGSTKLEKLSVYPICESCKINLDKSIFPLWVKLFFAGVMTLVVFSMFWNWRFYSSYLNIKQSYDAYAKGEVNKAASLMTKASNQVPEARDLVSVANFFTGIDLLTKDKSTAALAAFNRCPDIPAEYNLNVWVLQAEIGSSFDERDYKLFLTSSKAFLQLDTTQARSWASVSSAYACLYAQNGSDSLKSQSLKYLTRAKSIDDTSAGSKEYAGRILYRLDTRQIITKDQYDKKFPNGYTSNLLK